MGGLFSRTREMTVEQIVLHDHDSPHWATRQALVPLHEAVLSSSDLLPCIVDQLRRAHGVRALVPLARLSRAWRDTIAKQRAAFTTEHSHFSSHLHHPDARLPKDRRRMELERDGMCLLEQPLTHGEEHTVRLMMSCRTMMGSPYIGVAAPVGARKQSPPGEAHGSCAYRGSGRVTMAGKGPLPPVALATGTICCFSEASELRFQADPRIGVTQRDVEVEMRLSADGELSWLIDGELAATLSGIPEGYHFAIGRYSGKVHCTILHTQQPREPAKCS